MQRPTSTKRPQWTGPMRIPQALLVQVAGPDDPTPVGRTIALTASGERSPFPRSLAVLVPGLAHAIEQLAVTRWGLWIGKLHTGAGAAIVVEDRRWLRPGDAVVVGRTVLRLRELELPEVPVDYLAVPMVVDVFAPGGEPVRSIGLPEGTIIVGSGEDADATIDDPHVSGRHCCIERKSTGVVVSELGSSNGTFVYVRPGDLVPFGCMLTVGRSTYRVLRAAAPMPRRRGAGEKMDAGTS